jgi:hypothetical protein
VCKCGNYCIGRERAGGEARGQGEGAGDQDAEAEGRGGQLGCCGCGISLTDNECWGGALTCTALECVCVCLSVCLVFRN